jgi:O-antigen/teichoic acid export membrane protein
MKTLLSSPLKGRLIRGLGAHGILQVIQTIIRIAEVPLLLGTLGATGYGEWLMIATLPTVLVISDGGVTKTTQRLMAINSGIGNSHEVKASFQNGWTLLIILSFISIVSICIGVFLLPIRDWLNLTSITKENLSWTIILLALQVFVAFQCTLIAGAYSSIKRNATGTLLLSLAFFIGFLGLSIGVAAYKSMLAGAIGLSGGWLLGFLIMLFSIKKKHPQFEYGFTHCSQNRMREMMAPSFASMAIPLADVLNIQGVRLVLGITAGPTTLATFSAIRTLCRVALQPVLSITRTVEPEMSIAYGEKNNTKLNRLLVKTCQSAILLSLALSTALLVGGHSFFEIWTKGQLLFDWQIFIALLAASFFSAFWAGPLTLIVSTNRHLFMGSMYFFVYGILSIIGVGLISKFFSASNASLWLAVVEILIACIAFTICCRLTGIPISAFMRRIFSV